MLFLFPHHYDLTSFITAVYTNKGWALQKDLGKEDRKI